VTVLLTENPPKNLAKKVLENPQEELVKRVLENPHVNPQEDN
jgi:hypothetical protein